MKNVTDILRKFTEGEVTLAEANAALAAEGAGISLDPKKNELTAEELSAVKIGGCVHEVSGFGLLDTGTGSLDKVEVKDGRLVNADCGDMTAFCIIGGKTYRVCGDRLED